MSSPKSPNVAELLEMEVRRFIAGAILFNLKVADQVGLNGTDMQCLNLLELQGSATPGELARFAMLTTGGITVVLDRLEKAGYVRREPNPQDRRSSIVRPVASAKTRKLHALYQSKGEALRQVLSSYDEQELNLILDFFRRTNSESTKDRESQRD
jgi:DNA-binding MarR family transcriptional regulator